MLMNVVLRDENFWGKTSVIVLAGGYGIAMVSIDYYDPEVAVIHDVFVHRAWRGAGIGNKALDAALKEAERLDASVARIAVEPGSWVEDWYGRKGFVRTGSHEYKGHDLDVMEKEIIRSDAVEPQSP